MIGEKLGRYKTLAARPMTAGELASSTQTDERYGRRSCRPRKFEVVKAKEFPCKAYDFAAEFDCLDDMGDPVGTAAHVRRRWPTRAHR